MIDNIQDEKLRHRGVSPVIGVILMVAITVILAAVIGAFVLDLGGAQETTPSVTFDFEYDGALTITLVQGQRLTNQNTANLRVVGTTSGEITPLASGLPYSAGDQILSGSSVPAGQTIRVIWVGNEGSTSTLAEFEL